MTTTQITLTIGKETRVVDAHISERPCYNCITVNGIKMVTRTGNQEHTGWVEFVQNDSGVYDISQATDIRYSGMRGNGHAAKSKFASISF